MVSQELLLPWLPRILQSALAADPSRAGRPWEMHLSAAVLFLDMSGFTRLTERYAQRGVLGVEALTARLNASFAPVIERILREGGDIVKFAGDALIVLFPQEERSAEASPGPPLERALVAGLGLQADFHQREMDEGLPLSLRVSVAEGDCLLQQVGGERGRWELLVGGEALHRAAGANAQARPGEVVLSLETLPSSLDAAFLCTPRAPGIFQLQARSSQGSRVPSAPTASGRAMHALSPDVLLRFIPGAVRARLEAGQEAWLGELRRVSVLFVQLKGLTQAPPIARSHALVQTLQQLLYRYEGSLNKLSTDDKGTALVAAFGLPPLAHEDDPIRALQVALAILTQLESLGLEVSIGLTTGTAFCGPFGSAHRQEYTMLGDVVNLAARLMQGAEGGILCDFATWQAGRDRVVLETLPPRSIKGKANPVPVFRPLRVKALPELEQVPAMQDRTACTSQRLVGRLEERAQLSTFLQAALAGHGQVAVVEGEAGIGKSSLLGWVLEQAQHLRLPVLLSGTEALEAHTPYFVWRRLLTALLPTQEQHSPSRVLEACRQRVVRLRESPGWQRTKFQGQGLSPEALVRLLSMVFSLGMELPGEAQGGVVEPTQVAELTQVARAELLRELLVGLVRQALEEQTGQPDAPFLLLIEDAHWLDSGSWHCLLHLKRQVRSLSLVLSSRGLTPPLPVDAAQLLLAPGVLTVRLERLGTDELVGLVAHRLGVRSVPARLRTLLQSRSEGHPFFAEELVQTLLEQGIVTLEGDAMTWQARDTEPLVLTIPETLQGLIISRIDRLGPSEQLTLKVASVIGRSFSLRLLRDIHPVEAPEAQLLTDLTILQTADLTLLETPEPELSWLFKHVIVLEVAYNLMLFAQRRALHARVAQRLDAQHATERAHDLPLRAWHWLKAEKWEEALRVAREAGEHALSQAAYREAERFFRDVLTCLEHLPHLPVAIRVRCEQQLGEALLGQGQIEEAREWLERVLIRHWGPLPTTRLGWFFHVVRRTTQAVIERFSRPVPNPLDALVLGALEPLQVIYFYRVEGGASLALSLERLRLAFRLQDSDAQARVLATLVVVARGFGLNSQAKRWEDKVLAQPPDVLSGPGGVRIRLALAHASLVCGALSEAAYQLEEGFLLLAQRGDHRQVLELRGLEGWLLMLRGHIRRGRQYAEDTLALARSHSDVQGQIWGGVGLAQIHILSGGLDKAEATLREVEELPPSPLSVGDELWLLAAWAALLQRHSRIEEAVRSVTLASRLILGLPNLVLNMQVLRALGQLFRALLVWQLIDGAEVIEKASNGPMEAIGQDRRGPVVRVQMGEGVPSTALERASGARGAVPILGREQGSLQAVQAKLERILRVSSRTVLVFQPEWHGLRALQALGLGRVRYAASLWQAGLERARTLNLPLEELLLLQDCVRYSSTREAEYLHWRTRLRTLELEMLG